MRLSDDGGRTPERSAAELVKVIQTTLSAALAEGRPFCWDVRRHVCCSGGAARGGTHVELRVLPAEGEHDFAGGGDE